MTSPLLLAQSSVNIPGSIFQYHPGAARFANSPGSLLSFLLPNVIVIAGLIFLIIIIYSGFNLIHDAGSGNAQEMAKHRQAVTFGAIGFLIVISAYFILQIVGFSTGVDFTNLGSFDLFNIL